MSYATTNPPQLISAALGGRGQIWEYLSTDPDTDVDDAGYFTNAQDLGMRAGDIVFVHDTNASPYKVTMHSVTEINADGSADLSAALA